MKLYKVTDTNGRSCHGGTGKWSLPKNGEPGEWWEIGGEIIACENGLHACRRADLVNWLGPCIHELEHEGEIIDGGDKVVVRKARLVRTLETWSERTQRLFAADCAERVLHLYEAKYPNDSRVRNCIEISRKVAVGELPISELDTARAAAWAAARAAAWAAARAAAWAAARAAAGAAARAAAWDAASAAAWDAASAAAWDAASAAAWDAAERAWQTERLFEYLDGVMQ
jgi:hypothetical protein